MGHLTALGPRRRRRRWRAPALRGRACTGPATTRRMRDDRTDRDRRRPSSGSSAAAVRTSRPSRPRSRSSTSSASPPSSRSSRPTGRPTTCSATRRTAAGRGIRVIVAGAGGAAHLPGHARRQDDPAGHRRADPHPAPRRPGLAPVDRPDAARHPGRDGRHRERDERGPACGRHPRPRRPGPGGAARRMAGPPDRSGPRRPVERRPDGRRSAAA